MAQYATKEQLKAYIPDDPKVVDGSGIVVGTVTYDQLLDTVLQRVTAQMDRVMNRTFIIAAATTKLFDGSGTRILSPAGGLDLLSIDASGLKVLIDGTGGSNWITVPATDVFLQPADRPSTEGASYVELTDKPTSDATVFTAGLRTVSVKGSWAKASAVPLPIEQMCLALAVRTWRARGAGFGDTVGLSSDALDQLIVTKAFTPVDYEILRTYKRKVAFV